MTRVGFVTCATWPDLLESDAIAARALEARGVSVAGVPWNAPGSRFETTRFRARPSASVPESARESLSSCRVAEKVPDAPE